jgi:hypothetical protein
MALVAFLFVGMLVAAVGLWLRSSTGDDRVRDLAIVAMDMRFKLAERDTRSIEKMPFSLFRMGTSQSAQNVMSGTRDGLAITMFDYRYRIPLHSSDYRSFTCAFITIPAACPWLRLTHENAATRLGDHLGMPDVELEYGEFNPSFPGELRAEVCVPDARWADDGVAARRRPLRTGGGHRSVGDDRPRQATAR